MNPHKKVVRDPFFEAQGRQIYMNGQRVEEPSTSVPLGPIPLITIEDRDSLKTNPAALNVLRNLDPSCAISVVCVCGIYRSGKSSLLNWLLGIETWKDWSKTKGEDRKIYYCD